MRKHSVYFLLCLILLSLSANESEIAYAFLANLLKDSNQMKDVSEEEVLRHLQRLEKDELLKEDEKGNSVLHIVARSDNEKVVEIILRYLQSLGDDFLKGVEFNLLLVAQNNEGDTPLHLALKNKKFIPLFITSGNVNEANKTWNTPLHIAIKEDASPLMIEGLLEHQARIDEKNWDGMTALMLELQKENPNEKIVKKLLDAGALIFIENNEGESVIDLAEKNPKSFELLQQYQDKKGQTYIHKIVLRLVQEYITKEGKKAPLSDDTREIFEDLLLRLISSKNVNMQDNLGNTPLHLAIADDPESIEVIQLLLKNGSNLNIFNKEGYTPLHRAVLITKEPMKLGAVDKSGNVDRMKEIIEVLLDAGSDPDASTTVRRYGKSEKISTPLEMAKKLGITEIISLLQSESDSKSMTQERVGQNLGKIHTKLQELTHGLKEQRA